MNRFFMGGYWGPRKESIEQCADRLHRFFADLAVCDPILTTWYELGRSRKQALQKPAEVRDRNYLLDHLNRERNRYDVKPRAVIEELGFNVFLWNGGDDERDAGLHIKCGLYELDMWNDVTINLPRDLGGLKQSDRMANVVAAVVRAWEPAWAGVMSDEATDVRDYDPKFPFVDWMVYVPRRIDRVPAPSRVIPLETGSLIVVWPDPLTISSAEALASIRRIDNLLRQ